MNRLEDPGFQEWLWGYDFKREVERAWELYEKGLLFPLVGGVRGLLVQGMAAMGMAVMGMSDRGDDRGDGSTLR